mmetsp:Transcript_15896/g.23944  ORF Transcript_15896/g.23944 Transcript_15896/m.23944 type:complete len:373 (-) Transcript_15896:102-1220(-)
MPQKSKLSRPDQLTAHFDRDWATQKSHIRSVRTERMNYSPTYSWDAKSDNPVSFSKLNADQLPTQPCRPCTLSGNRVIELETPGGMAVLNVTERPMPRSQLPLSAHQVDAGMTGNDLSGTIPMVSQASAEGKTIVMKKNYAYSNYDVHPPQFVAEEIPQFYMEAGKNGDQKLLTPAQRRKMMEIDAQQREAKGHLKQAVSERQKLKDSLVGPVYHRGVLMYDSNDNKDSEVYALKARTFEQKQEKAKKTAAQRQEALRKCGSSLATDFSNLVPETAPQYDIFQSKKSVPGRLSYEETQHRIFQKPDERSARPERTQRLRNEDLLGKNYNIISNTQVTHWPSSIPEVKDHRMAHPSQNSLSGTRNMQGSLRLG